MCDALDRAQLAAGGWASALVILAEVKAAIVGTTATGSWVEVREWLDASITRTEYLRRLRQWHYWCVENGFDPDQIAARDRDHIRARRRRQLAAERQRFRRCKLAWHAGNTAPMERHYPDIAARWRREETEEGAAYRNVKMYATPTAEAYSGPIAR